MACQGSACAAHAIRNQVHGRKGAGTRRFSAVVRELSVLPAGRLADVRRLVTGHTLRWLRIRTGRRARVMVSVSLSLCPKLASIPELGP
jgi:hypothetical protein